MTDPPMLPFDEDERWLPVDGWPGYEVSSLGRGRSLTRVISDGTVRQGQILKLSRQKHGGYREMPLSKNNVLTKRYIHVLVAAAFIGPCPEGKEVDHDDGNPENNAVTNLKYKTKSDNALDMIRHGTHNMARKTHCKHGHEFTPENTFIQKGNPKWRGCVQCKKDRSRARKLAA